MDNITLGHNDLLSQCQTTRQDQIDVIVHPRQTVGRDQSKSRAMDTFPSTIGTMAIYTPAADQTSKREIYTEIPFIVIHGMQTRRKCECNAFDAYEDHLNMCKQSVGMSDDDSLDPSPSKSFAGEIVKGKITRPLLIATIATAALQFVVGYNVVILNTPEKYVFPGHSTFAWSLAVGALAIGALLGSTIGARLSDSQGRRMTLIWNIGMFLIGGSIQALAPDLIILTAARFLIGIASGIATVLVPIYLGELAPPHLRGALGTVNQFAYAIGILAADLFSFPFATEAGWRQLFSVTIFVSLFQLMLLPFVVESPRWLLQQNPEDSNARRTLENLRGYQEHDELEMELSAYVHAAKAQGQERSTQRALLKEMLSQEHVRYLFFCIILLHTAQQMSGMNAVFYYSTSLFEGIIANPLVGTTVIGTVNVLFTYVALRLMDSCRRKSLLLWSIGGMFLACCTLILAHAGNFGSSVGLVAVNAYVAFYCIGMGPIPWLIFCEMFEAKYCATIMSICSQLSWGVNFVVSMAFPHLNEALGEYTFVPFACILFLSFIFTWQGLPETQGKTPAQVVADVERKHSRLDEEVGMAYSQW